VRNVNGREDRLLASIDEGRDSRSFYVRANASAIQRSAAKSEKRDTGKDSFSQCQHGERSRVPERVEDAPAQPPQVALQIIEKGGSKRAGKGLRSTPRSSPPKMKF